MPVFERSVLIDAPVEEVFAFHEQPDALTLLSPAFPPVRLLQRTGKGLEPNSRVELRIGPFHWVALHTTYTRNRRFEDHQESGPFDQWIHRHDFESVGGRTRLTDRIEYRLPGGPISNVLLGWIVNLGLRNMFRHRHNVTRQLCEKA